MFKFTDLVQVILKNGRLPRVRTSFCGFSIPPCYSKGRSDEREQSGFSQLLAELRKTQD